jgi:integrase
MLGVAFGPHLMRHILATILYRQDPNNGVVVQRKLRHSSLKTTERMYGVLSNAGANAAWQRELERFRRIDLRRQTTRGR